MKWTDDIMLRALRRLKPWMVAELANGPLDDPYCQICRTLLPVFESPHTGRAARHAALDVLMYHDEATYDPDERLDYGDDPWGDYYWASGIGCVVTYSRCLRVYAFARSLLRDPSCSIMRHADLTDAHPGARSSRRAGG